MIKTDNSESTIRLRKHQDTLVTVGKGIIVFSLWSVAKTIGTMLLNREDLTEAFKKLMGFADAKEAAVIPDDLIYAVVMIIMVIFLLIDLIIRLKVGRSAIREGRGIRKSGFYLFLTFLLIVSSFTTLLSYVMKSTQTETDLQIARAMGEELSFSAFVIELTSFVMMIEMLHSARYVRKHRACIESGKEVRDAA